MEEKDKNESEEGSIVGGSVSKEDVCLRDRFLHMGKKLIIEEF